MGVPRFGCNCAEIKVKRGSGVGKSIDCRFGGGEVGLRHASLAVLIGSFSRVWRIFRSECAVATAPEPQEVEVGATPLIYLGSFSPGTRT